MIEFKTRTLIAALLTVVGGGTAFFRYIEGWSWIDSYFFTVVTVSTVGYGNLVPETVIGKIGATVLIFTGLGVFAAAIQHYANYQLRARKDEREGWLNRLAHRHHAPGPHAPAKPDAETPER